MDQDLLSLNTQEIKIRAFRAFILQLDKAVLQEEDQAPEEVPTIEICQGIQFKCWTTQEKT